MDGEVQAGPLLAGVAACLRARIRPPFALFKCIFEIQCIALRYLKALPCEVAESPLMKQWQGSDKTGAAPNTPHASAALEVIAEKKQAQK